MKYLSSQLAYLSAHKRQQRNLLLLGRFLGALALMIIGYSIAFHYIMAYEGQDQHSWLTGFYWTLTVMSTLGFGDITFDSDLGRAFSLLVLLSGIVFLLILLPFTFIQFFWAPWMEAQAAARTPRALPPQMRGHAILTSYDAVTQALIARIEDFGGSYALIVPDLTEAQRLSDLGVRVMVGDLDDPQTFVRARVGQAAMVAATVGDAANTNIAFIVRGVADQTPVVAAASDPSAVQIMELAGVTETLQLTEIVGQSLARCTVGGDAVTHVVGRMDTLLIAEANAARTPLVGKTLRENRISELGVTVLGVWERGHFQHATPDTRVEANTILMMAGSAEQLQNYDEALAIYNVSGEPVVILGGGRIGRATGRALDERGIDWRMVEREPTRVRDAARTIVGNAADRHTLELAGIMKAPAVLITTHDDDTNLFLTLLCRNLRPDIQIVTRSTLERTVATLHRAGADFVQSYASLGAGAMLNLLRRSSVVTVAEGLDVFRLAAPESLDGKTLAESGVREKSGCSIVAIGVGDQLQINPPAGARLRKGQDLVLVGDAESRGRFADRFGQ